MAIYTRLLNGATGPTQRFQVPQSVPYVDDMFDPLFNREVIDYNKSLYGNRVMGTLAGYAQMWDHALTGEGGILGPGMGVLSTFGRSMDKADDLILGGLTEGVNALGHNVLHGSNDAPQNPLRNIMVNDYDYSGTKLLAAMGNSVSRMAGGAKLDETDFTSMGDRLSGSALDMMTDPGWLGSRLAKGKGLAAEVGSVLNSYDNVMAKVAGNVALPGMQHLAHKNMERIRRLLAANSPENMMDYSFEGGVSVEPYMHKWSSEESQTLYDEYMNWYKIAESNGDATPEETATADMVRMYKPKPSADPTADVTDASVGQQASNITVPKYPYVSELFADPKYSDYVSKYISDNINAALKLRDEETAEAMRIAGDLAQKHPDWTYQVPSYSKAPNQGNAFINAIDENGEEYIDVSDGNYTGFTDHALHDYLNMDFPDSNEALDVVNDLLPGGHLQYSKSGGNVHFVQKSAYVQDKVRDNVQQALLASTRRLAAQVGVKDVADKDFKQLTKELFPDMYPSKWAYKDDSKIADRVREQALRMLQYEDEYRRAESSVRSAYGYSDYLSKVRPQALKALDKNGGTTNAFFPWTPSSENFNPYVLWARDASKIMSIYGAATDAFSSARNAELIRQGLKDAKNADKDSSRFLRNFDDLLEDTPGRAPTDAEAKALAFDADAVNAGSELSRALPNANVRSLSELRELADALPKGLEVYVDDERLKYLPIDVPETDLDSNARIYLKAKSQIDARTKPYVDELKAEIAKPKAEQNAARMAELRKSIADNSYIELTKEERDAIDPNSEAWWLFGVPYEDKSGKTQWKSPTTDGAYTGKMHGKNGAYVGDRIRAGENGKYRYYYGPASAGYQTVMKRKFKDVRDPLAMLSVITQRNEDGSSKTFTALNTSDPSIVRYFLPHARHDKTPFMKEFKTGEDFLATSLEGLATNDYADELLAKKPDWYPTNEWASAKHTYNEGDKKTAFGKYVESATKAQKKSLAQVLRPVSSSADAAPSSLAKAVAAVASDPKAPNRAGISNMLKHSNTVVDEYCQKVIDTVYSSEFSDSPITPEHVEGWVRKYGTPRQKTLFAYIDKMKRNTILAKRGVNQYENQNDAMALETESDAVFKRFAEYDADGNMKGNKHEVSEYLALRNSLEDQTIQGHDFLTHLVDSGGYALEKCSADLSDADYAALKTALQNNVAAVNKAAKGNVLKFVEGKTSDGMRAIGYVFDVDNLDMKKDWNRIFSVFAKPLYLDDALFFRKDGQARAKIDALIKENPDVAMLDSLFDRVSEQAASFYKTLGIPMDTSTPSYFHHTMRETPEAAAVFDDVLTAVGIKGVDANGAAFDNRDKLAQIINALENSNAPSLRGQFGTKQYKRAYLGDFRAYGPGFSDDIRAIVADTFTKGTFDNINANTAQALFFNDNFGVNSYFETKENLIDAVRQKNEKGVYSGNMANLDLVSPKIDDNGKVVGFTHYDKLSDIDVDRAWKSGNAILVPTEVVGKLDRLLRKNARMSSPAYRFFNKFLTLPFKFGVLANPGFLAGNVQDAYYKQAEAMAEKYGTSIEEELANVGMQYRRTVQLSNQFDDVRQKYETFLKNGLDSAKDTDISAIRNTYGKSMGVIKKGGHLDAAVIMQNPDYFKEWVNYMNNELPKDSRELRVAKFYTALNSYQSLAEFENNRLDLEDVLATSDASRRGNAYDRPTSFVERFMYGDASKRDPAKGLLGNVDAYGLTLNNPYSDAILKKSNQFESLTRTATILNDLEHRGFTQDRIDEILGNDPAVEKAMYQDLHIKIMDAVNVMNTANFDYDTVSDLMDKASYVIPFPTFYMKNMAFWLNTLAEHPERLDDIISFQESLWAGVPQKDEYAQEAKGRGAYPIGVGNQHLTGIVKQSPINSMFGAFNSLNNFGPDLSYRLNPVTRPITRHLQNPEDVKYRPYSTDVYEKNINAKSSQFSDLAYLFHQLNPFERFVNTALRTPRKVAINQAQLSDFAPSMFQPNFNK